VAPAARSSAIRAWVLASARCRCCCLRRSSSSRAAMAARCSVSSCRMALFPSARPCSFATTFRMREETSFACFMAWESRMDGRRSGPGRSDLPDEGEDAAAGSAPCGGGPAAAAACAGAPLERLCGSPEEGLRSESSGMVSSRKPSSSGVVRACLILDRLLGDDDPPDGMCPSCSSCCSSCIWLDRMDSFRTLPAKSLA